MTWTGRNNKIKNLRNANINFENKTLLLSIYQQDIWLNQKVTETIKLKATWYVYEITYLQIKKKKKIITLKVAW